MVGPASDAGWMSMVCTSPLGGRPSIPDSHAPPYPVLRKRSIAVLHFANLIGRPQNDWLRTESPRRSSRRSLGYLICSRWPRNRGTAGEAGTTTGKRRTGKSAFDSCLVDACGGSGASSEWRRISTRLRPVITVGGRATPALRLARSVTAGQPADPGGGSEGVGEVRVSDEVGKSRQRTL